MAINQRDVGRLFLQAILSRGMVSEAAARLLRKKCVEAVNTAGELDMRHDPSDAAWEAFVKSLNASLDKLDFEFRASADENTGKNFYSMVNRKDDEIGQLATDYTPNEITFFKAVVEQIMLADNEAYSVSSMAALRETGPNITKAHGEVLLSSFVARGWLTGKSKKGRYALGVRSSLELLPYLTSTYPDEILECTICHAFVTRGIACTVPKCGVRMHHHCVEKYFRTTRARKNTVECPTCAAPWHSPEQLVPVGEEAAPHGDGSSQRRRTRAQTQDSDEDEEEAQMSGQDDEEEEQERPVRGKGKGKAKTRAKSETVDSDADVEMVSEEERRPAVKQEPRRSSRRQ